MKINLSVQPLLRFAIHAFFQQAFCAKYKIKPIILLVSFATLVQTNVRGQAIAVTGDQYHLYGPNTTWGQYFQVGGNGKVTDHAFVAVTNGNLHMDAKPGFSTSINYYNEGNTYINPRGGRVGIGTTDPATKLEVMQTTSGWTINSRVNAVSPGEINGFKLYSGYIGEDKWAGIASVAESMHSNKTGLALYAGTSEKVRISDNGNVGINTLTPETKLDVQGAIRVGGNPANLDPLGNLFDFQKFAGTGKLIVGWNRAAGDGETDFIANEGAGTVGGFAFYSYNNANIEKQLLRLLGNGNVGIGIAMPAEKLAVNGNIRAKEIKVEATNWPDYVFEKGYKVETLNALESYIKANKHLPDMPSAKDVETNGVQLGEMVKMQQKKIEELTLHLIEKDKQITTLQSAVEKQGEILKEIQKKLK